MSHPEQRWAGISMAEMTQTEFQDDVVVARKRICREVESSSMQGTLQSKSESGETLQGSDWDLESMDGSVCMSSFDDERPSPAPSVLSMKSDQSMIRPDVFGGDCTPWEAGGVPCSVCSMTAFMSCLTCIASFCKIHVKQHYTAPALRRHRLVEPPTGLEQRLCQQHHRELELFCKTDSTAVCVLCVAREHSGHEITEQAENESLQLNKPEMAPQRVSEVQAVFPEAVNREDFFQYFYHFTLDPNTAYRYLHLSEGNKVVNCSAKALSYPHHPERFNECSQVLCTEGVSGRCYWEVEWSGGMVDIAVSYKSISRKGWGNDCGFGYNTHSWSLILSSHCYYFRHNNKQSRIPLRPSPTIGVYVDHRAGTLAFYSISDTMTLMHRVQTKFSDTLYPGFWVSNGSSVKLF